MTTANACPDCGRPITLNPSGWWSHDGMPDGCWRLSMDGPAEPAADPEPAELLLEQGSDEMRAELERRGVLCEWFARCGRPAVDLRAHPIIGGVPVCERCARFVDEN